MERSMWSKGAGHVLLSSFETGQNQWLSDRFGLLFGLQGWLFDFRHFSEGSLFPAIESSGMCLAVWNWLKKWPVASASPERLCQLQNIGQNRSFHWVISTRHLKTACLLSNQKDQLLEHPQYWRKCPSKMLLPCWELQWHWDENGWYLLSRLVVLETCLSSCAWQR